MEKATEGAERKGEMCKFDFGHGMREWRNVMGNLPCTLNLSEILYKGPMKRILIILLYAIFVTLQYSCGTTGHIKLYNYSISKDSVENNLLTIINRDSIYTRPLKWNDYELGTDTIYDIFVLYRSGPMEIYQLDFIGTPSDWNNEQTSTLALVGVFDGKLWHFENDLSSLEKARVIERLEIEILSKMIYRYRKAE